MRYEWQTQKSNIETLTQQIEKFLHQKNFTTKTQYLAKEKTQIQISATPTKNAEIGQKINIEIQKTQKGITIDFKSTEKTQKNIKIGLITSFLIGGSLLLREIKSQEKLETLEEEFWKYTQKTLSELQS
jgi:hypothetical protein